MQRRVVQRLFRFALLLLLGAAASSQNHTDQNEVLVSVLVMDRTGASAAGLTVGDFRLAEDGVEQPIEHFSSAVPPMSVAIVMDTGSSRNGALAQAKQGVLEFLGAMKPEDEFVLLRFNDPPGVDATFTTDRGIVSQMVRATRSEGPSPLFDTVFRAAEREERGLESAPRRTTRALPA